MNLTIRKAVLAAAVALPSPRPPLNTWRKLRSSCRGRSRPASSRRRQNRVGRGTDGDARQRGPRYLEQFRGAGEAGVLADGSDHEACRGSLANIVQVTVFIKESRYGDRFVEMRKDYFQNGNYPGARSSR